jgi:antagonist of KipI
MSPGLTIIRPGVQATVQDLGRPGYLADGIAPSGAFDHVSLRWANHLVGNDPGDRFLVGSHPGAAGLEVLLGGFAATVDAEVTVAVTGARARVTVDGALQPQWESFLLGAGARLEIAMAERGARLYLAVAGGIDVPCVLGSRATHARAGLGGLDGRALAKGDTLPVGSPAGGYEWRWVPDEHRPRLEPPWMLGAVPGPQDALFTPDSVERFFASEWRLSKTSDRMGCRFEGPKLDFGERAQHLARQAGSDPSNIVDDVTPLGGIQVPSGVEPIAMGVDFPSIGGYAKIATVISAHVPRLGQVRPGEPVRFVQMTTGQAVAELREILLPSADRALQSEAA